MFCRWWKRFDAMWLKSGDKSDVIVVLGHIHDTSEADAILREVPEVSAAIVGHNHEGYKEIHNTDGRVAVLVHSYGVEFGRLELDVNMQTHRAALTSWKKIPVDSRKITPDPVVAHEVAHWEAKVSKTVDVPIGESKRRLSAEEVRTLVERAMTEQMGADIAFVNQGGIRDVLPQGRIPRAKKTYGTSFPLRT